MLLPHMVVNRVIIDWLDTHMVMHMSGMVTHMSRVKIVMMLMSVHVFMPVSMIAPFLHVMMFRVSHVYTSFSLIHFYVMYVMK